MRSICLLLPLALPALDRRAGRRSKTEPAFAGVQGAFFALSVADAEASAKWYVEKLGLAVDMRTKSGKIAVIVLWRIWTLLKARKCPIACGPYPARPQFFGK